MLCNLLTERTVKQPLTLAGILDLATSFLFYMNAALQTVSQLFTSFIIVNSQKSLIALSSSTLSIADFKKNHFFL